jgi:hypothetical protein
MMFLRKIRYKSLKLTRMSHPFLLLFLFILLPSCTIFDQTVEINQNPTYGTEVGLENSLVLYEDDFSNPESGWQTFSSDSGSAVTYEHQGLRFFINEENTDHWSIQNINIQDVQLAVDASKIGGPDDNIFGLICRFTEENSFYEFVISSDGYYAILKIINGEYVMLSGDSMDFHSAINLGRGTNRIRADCVGDQLSLFINNQLIESVKNDEIIAGRIGLIAGTTSESGTDILFDNFVLYQP